MKTKITEKRCDKPKPKRHRGHLRLNTFYKMLDEGISSLDEIFGKKQNKKEDD